MFLNDALGTLMTCLFLLLLNSKDAFALEMSPRTFKSPVLRLKVWLRKSITPPIPTSNPPIEYEVSISTLCPFSMNTVLVSLGTQAQDQVVESDQRPLLIEVTFVMSTATSCTTSSSNCSL